MQREGKEGFNFSCHTTTGVGAGQALFFLVSFTFLFFVFAFLRLGFMQNQRADLRGPRRSGTNNST